MLTHHPNCNANYSEKPEGEHPQAINHQDLGNGFFVDTCVDCGAFDTNLPAEDDPYWDSIRDGVGALPSTGRQYRGLLGPGGRLRC